MWALHTHFLKRVYSNKISVTKIGTAFAPTIETLARKSLYARCKDLSSPDEFWGNRVVYLHQANHNLKASLALRSDSSNLIPWHISIWCLNMELLLHNLLSQVLFDEGLLQLTITLLIESFIIKPKNIDESPLSQSMHTFGCNQLTTSPFHCAATNCPFSCTHTSRFHQKHQETLVHNSQQDEIVTKLKNLQYQQQLRLILTVHQNVDSDKHTSTCLITRGTPHQC